MTATQSEIIKLARYYQSGNTQEFELIVKCIAAKAKRQGRSDFADQLIREIGTHSPDLPEALAPLVDMRGSNTTIDDLVVSADVAAALANLIRERQSAPKLLQYGYAPASKILLAGPPGTGKTMTASALANALEMELLVVRLESVIHSYLGSTGANIASLFEAANQHRAVYLFDECDSIASGRGSDDVGEMRRIVNSLLRYMEAASSDSLIVMATNAKTLMDEATFRRFDLILAYELPTDDDAIIILQRQLGRSGALIDWEQVLPLVASWSQAELTGMAIAAAKRALLDGDGMVSTEILLREFARRAKTAA
jgi:SpoVK/Ycf46/Vps4 family AAA+-type ATPase